MVLWMKTSEHEACLLTERLHTVHDSKIYGYYNATPDDLFVTDKYTKCETFHAMMFRWLHRT